MSLVTYIGNGTNDPLDLGIIRPDPPEDPDKEANENQIIQRASYAQSLLDEDEYVKLQEFFVENNGVMRIDQVRDFCKSNMHDDVVTFDAELLEFIDSRIDYKLFIVRDNIYTREEVMQNFAFQELSCTPEMHFDQYEIGMFVTSDQDESEQSERGERGEQGERGERGERGEQGGRGGQGERGRKHIEKVAKAKNNKIWNFCSAKNLRDIIKRGRSAQNEEKPVKVALTKIYMAGDRFEKFVMTQDVIGTLIRISRTKEPGTFNIANMLGFNMAGTNKLSIKDES